MPIHKTVAVVAITTIMACDAAPSAETGPGSVTSPATSSATEPDSASSADYAPDIDPGDFVATVDNPLFPLEPGTTFHLRGETEDGIERETITVTESTRQVLGVTTTVVKDVVRVDGRVAELTYDWYAQDRAGNVWYFGEDTAEYEDGEIVSREGSWEAGVDGAQPGIIMNAEPRVTDSFRQEYYEGEAEDMYWVVAVGGSKRVPAGTFEDVVRTLEWTPLEPNIVVEKLYSPGTGLLMERALSGPKEIVRLVDVIR